MATEASDCRSAIRDQKLEIRHDFTTVEGGQSLPALTLMKASLSGGLLDSATEAGMPGRSFVW